MTGAMLVLGGLSLRFATWPKVDDSDLTAKFEQQQRIGSKPATQVSEETKPARRLQFKLGGLVNAGVRSSCAAELTVLQAMCDADAPVTLILADRRAGQWTIVENAVTPLFWTEAGDTAEAEVQLTLWRAEPGAVRIGIVRTPGKKPTTPAKGKGKPATGAKRR